MIEVAARFWRMTKVRLSDFSAVRRRVGSSVVENNQARVHEGIIEWYA